MSKWLKVLIGIILIIDIIALFIVDFLGFGNNAFIFLKGGLIWLIILMGLMFIILGLTSSNN